MPYVDGDARDRLDDAVALDVGELTYLLTQTAIEYLEVAGLSFASAGGGVIAAMECTKLEFYRRVLAPYEDAAIARNGDVYPPSILGQRPKVD